MSPPAGQTLTFLFTDIEGSTSRWEADREAMATSLERHDRLSAEAVEQAGGTLFKTTGDGCCAVFTDAESAIEAALKLREMLDRQAWPESVAPLRVRCGVHTGPAEERGGDYFGPTLNRVARVMAAGHGGQILISDATRRLLSAPMPLRDLGEHRLRDLLEPEHIFQVDESDEQHPPLRTLDPRTNNLPIQVTPFVGRSKEVAELTALIPQAPLITLTGPGGTGKTRLSLQAAADLIDRFDGVYFVGLTPVQSDDDVAPAIADAIDLPVPKDGDPLRVLLDHLANRHDLLVLDNFEHLTGAAPLIGKILDSVAAVSIVVTSRELLNLRAERHYPVTPLGVPPSSQLSAQALAGYEAVNLFVERAQAANPSFALDDATAPDVAAICRRLDGLPLAIELAAARTRLFGPTQLRARLESDLSLLSGGPVDAPRHHQTLADTIRWSYDLLDDDEQVLLRRLSVFVGGAPMDAVEPVCQPDRGFDAFSAVAALADKSLVRIDYGRGGEPRVEMLETIRAFARDELEASDESEAVLRSYVEFFVDLAQQAEPELRGRDQTFWMDRLEDEFPNLEAALSWSLNGEEVGPGLRIVAALRDYWFYQGRYREMGRWADLAVSRLTDEPSGLQGGVYLTAGFHAYGVYREDNQDLIQKAIDLFQEAGDKNHQAMATIWLSGSQEILGNLGVALVSIEEGVALAKEVGSDQLLAQALNMWGEMERSAGNFDRARELQEQGLVVARRTGEERRIAMLSHNIGMIAHHQGDDETALRLLLESLDLAIEVDFVLQTAHCLLSLAEHLALAGAPEVGAQVVGTADAYFHAVGLLAQPADAPDFDRIQANLEATLGSEAFAAEIARGSLLSLDEAVALVHSSLET
ncbi:MAG: tetratricopeptide repeat protein [Acidimicrobiia bacterium]